MAQNRNYSSLPKVTSTTADPGSAGTTLTVVDTSSYSVLDGNFPYTLLVNWGLSDQELMSVTARPSGTTFTVTRGLGGTTAQPHGPGATVFHGVYSSDFTELASHRGSDSTPTVTGVHGVSGSVVGTSDAQTLSNKVFLYPLASYTANHTATTSEEYLFASAASASITITLPTASGVAGQSYTVVRTDSTIANTLTVATTSAQTINGATTYASLWAQYAYVQVVSDGSNWTILDAHNIPEPWQTPSYNTNWSASTTFNGLTSLRSLTYRRDTSDNLWMVGCFKAGGTLPSSSVFLLPAAYRPVAQQLFPLLRNNAAAISGGGAMISSSGNFNVFSNASGIAINNEYMVDAVIPLGNIS